jgi:hypothetical protein
MDFAAGVPLSEAHNPMSPPLHTVYVYYTVYLLARGGGGLNQREGRGSNSQSGSKIPT